MEQDDYKSRSQKKRESTALQKAGEELCLLNEKQRNKLGVPGDLNTAINEYNRLKDHEARRRQMQYIGRLMREAEEIDSILQGLEILRNNKQKGNASFHFVEKTREMLLQEDEDQREMVLQETMRIFPKAKEGQLRHLITAALAEKKNKKPPKAFRELFRYLQEMTEAR